mmetsp:Transcript_73374/g.185033  ORF Transcript_73374/g.185033 Transcript_73374/m.185033 type:complete len:204 (-) Transcript_73374:115-726(-)
MLATKASDPPAPSSESRDDTNVQAWMRTRNRSPVNLRFTRTTVAGAPPEAACLSRMMSSGSFSYCASMQRRSLPTSEPAKEQRTMSANGSDTVFVLQSRDEDNTTGKAASATAALAASSSSFLLTGAVEVCAKKACRSLKLDVAEVALDHIDMPGFTGDMSPPCCSPWSENCSRWHVSGLSIMVVGVALGFERCTFEGAGVPS